MSPIDGARAVVERAIADRVFPAAALHVGDSAGTLWCEACGTLTFDPDAPATAIDTPFDLASLTKALATTSLVMDLTRTGRVRLDDLASAYFPEWRGADREHVTVRDLLEHASGLAARLVDPPPHGRREIEHEICLMPLEYGPRQQSVYSDLGFLLLGFLAADRGGATLSSLFEQLWNDVRSRTRRRDDPSPGHQGEDVLTFDLPAERRRVAAPTLPLPGDPRRGRVLAGEVHDDYAAALGGAAGHSGLFGTAPAVGTMARAILRAARGESDVTPALSALSAFSPGLVRAFTAKSTVPGSSRALGWDTMLPTSSCGTRMTPSAFGHVGFTGTSLWIDPQRDRYFVLLTNRACAGGSLDAMRAVRRSFHDALGDL